MREVRYGSRSAHLEFDNRVIAYPIKEHIIGQNALGLWMVVVRSVQVCRLGRIDRPSSDIRYHPFIISDRFRADRLRERSGMPVKRMTRAVEPGETGRALLIDFSCHICASSDVEGGGLSCLPNSCLIRVS